jgi:hypothetical protein
MDAGRWLSVEMEEKKEGIRNLRREKLCNNHLEKVDGCANVV